MIVMKFGGTSVQDAAAIRQVAKIVSAKIERAPIIVVSAMARVTDTLLAVARTAQERRFDKAALFIEELRQRHLKTARELLSGSAVSLPDGYSLEQVEQGLNEQIAELEGLARSIATLGEFTPRSQDAIASFGERLSSLII